MTNDTEPRPPAHDAAAIAEMVATLEHVAEWLGDEPETPAFPSVHHATTVALIRRVRASLAQSKGEE